MKSPARNVGSIEPDGIRNGSTTKDRSSSTITMTGKNERDQSTYHGIGRGAPTLVATNDEELGLVAKALFERALAILEKALGPDHPDVATSLNNLAAMHEAIGGFNEARALHERALAIREKALGPDHPDVALSLSNLAAVQKATGALAEALRLNERALTIRTNTLGPDHPDVAKSLSNLATLHELTGGFTEARALHERALFIREQALGPDHPDVAMSLSNLAGLYIAGGQPHDALPLLERAVLIFDGQPGVQTAEFETHFNLAKALAATNGDRARAIVEAGKAHAGYQEAGASKSDQLAEVDQWLAAQ